MHVVRNRRLERPEYLRDKIKMNEGFEFRHFSKEDTQTPSQHVKRCSAQPAYEKMLKIKMKSTGETISNPLGWL